LNDNARRLSPRQWGKQLFMIKTSGGNALLVTRSGKKQITPQYVLKKSVTLRGHHYIEKAARVSLEPAREIVREALQKIIDSK
jgi:hypothetical protein